MSPCGLLLFPYSDHASWMNMKLKLYLLRNATMPTVFYLLFCSFQSISSCQTLTPKRVWQLDYKDHHQPCWFFSPLLVEHFRLQGNPLCTITNFIQFCGAQNDDGDKWQGATNSTIDCPPQACPPPYEYLLPSPVPCFCSAPVFVGYRLKSPGFSYFQPYMSDFEEYLSSGLSIYPYQLQINSVLWQKGPRLAMYLKIFPVYKNDSRYFNKSEIQRIRSMFTGWNIGDSDLFGPYELLNFTLLGPYEQG